MDLAHSARLATAGWAEQGAGGGIAFLLIFLAGGALFPAFLLGQGGWWTLLGVCLLILDFIIVHVAGTRIYRILRYRWRMSEYAICFLLLPVPALAGLFNFLVFWGFMESGVPLP